MKNVRVTSAQKYKGEEKFSLLSPLQNVPILEMGGLGGASVQFTPGKRESE